MQKLNGFWFSFWIFALCMFGNAYAEQRDFQTWYVFQAIVKTHSKDKILSHVRLWLEAQERIGGDSSRLTQSLIRPGLGYALTENLSIWLGYAWTYSAAPLTPVPFQEDRIWEQLLWVKTYQYFTLSNRFRSEQRFIENRPKTAYRLRELLKISIPFKYHQQFSFVSSDEVFYHANNYIGSQGQGFEQNRFFVGLGYKPNKTFNTEIGYMNQYIKRFGRPNFLANIISMNFYLNF